jgi:Tol biopolymer transport system component
MLSSCVSAGAESGVYFAWLAEGAPGRIGTSTGSPAWSPTADSVVWSGEDGLFLKALSAREPTRLYESAVAGKTAWSPDGMTLAFIDRNRASLVVMDAASGIVQFNEPVSRDVGGAVPHSLLTLGGPSWSPDGSLLAFVCWDGAGDETCVVQADGSNRRQVTHLEPSQVDVSSGAVPTLPAASKAGPPSRSPDGAFLAVAAYPEQRGAPRGVFVIDIRNGSARRVTSVEPNSAISWFPDGDSVLFSATQEGRSDALRVAITELGEERMTAQLPAGARNPALSPGGGRLAVESGGEIVVLDRKGIRLEFAVTGLYATEPAWNRDSTAIVFAAADDPIASYT